MTATPLANCREFILVIVAPFLPLAKIWPATLKIELTKPAMIERYYLHTLRVRVSPGDTAWRRVGRWTFHRIIWRISVPGTIVYGRT
ncbi:hypothetical protein B0H19DRAFT_1149692 [Mycena capillaripes]|nr:hypothetical protein B0H19DRAFT_1149692 [Mycena capillaripes]